MTVALAAGAWADAESFESAEAGDWAVATPWATEDTGAKLKVVAYGDSDTAYTYETTGDNTRAATFGTDQAKYLSVDTASTKPLWRSIAAGAATIADGDGAYVFDALVQFTGTDTAPTLATGDRFLLWLNTEGTTPVLTVTCGVIGGTTVQVPLDAAVSEGTWARVTIKDVAITSELTGFIVFIDGKVAAASATDYANVGTITSTYKEAAGRAKKYQLFPSAATGLTVTKIGFEGTCKLDDLQMVAQADAPAFTVFNATPDPIVPGATAEFDSESDADAYAASTSNIKAPEGEAWTDEKIATYRNLFATGTVSAKMDNTGYEVVFNTLTDAAKETVQNTTEAIVVKITGAEVTVADATPGLYYAIETSATEDGTYTAGTWVQADANGNVTFPAVNTDADVQFFKVVSAPFAPVAE